ncbi:MAG: hypothetical protein AAF235_02995, partial [Planctomycetota bacterium]
MNVLIAIGFFALQKSVPRSTANKRVALYGSRFFAPADAVVETAPSDPVAREDRPVEGTDPMVRDGGGSQSPSLA